DRYHAGAGRVRDGRGEHEAARLDAGHDVEAGRALRGDHRVHDPPERRAVGQQRADVLEHHAVLREVGHVDHVLGHQGGDLRAAVAGGRGHRRRPPERFRLLRRDWPDRRDWAGRAPTFGAAPASSISSGLSTRGSSRDGSLSVASVRASPPLRVSRWASARRLASTRWVWAASRGSRSFSSASSGVARNREAKKVTVMPTNSTRPRSFSVPAPSTPAPMNSSPPTGSNATMEVLMERIMTWLTARLAASP